MLPNGQSGLEMRTDLLLIEVNSIFLILARDMWNIDGDENVTGLLFESNQDEQNSGKVVFGFLVALDRMSRGEENESWDVAVKGLVDVIFESW